MEENNTNESVNNKKKIERRSSLRPNAPKKLCSGNIEDMISQTPQTKRIKWDDHQLEELEKEKNSHPKRKITEPKTPYCHIV